MALRTADQLSRISIGKSQLAFLLNMPTASVRFLPSFIPLKSMISHIGQYKFACKHLQGGLNVLDVACGTGYGSEMLRLQGNSVIGVDINQGNIQFARHNYPSNSYNVGNAEDLSEYKSRSFDAIVSIQTIEHLGHPKKAVREFKRLLKTNGILIGAIPISCKHRLDEDSEAKEIYLFSDCKELVSSEFPNTKWFFNDLKTNCILQASEAFLKDKKTHCGDFIFIAK